MTLLRDEGEARDFVAARCDRRGFAQLEHLVNLLKLANRSQNLIASATLPAIWLRHIADSAQLLDHVPTERPHLWVDLGTGAGFPGLGLAIMRPEWSFRLIESRKLRVQWLRSAVEELALTNCKVIGSDVRKAPPLSADVISARAFAPLDRLLAFSTRFSTTATWWVLPKGQSAAQELARLPTPHRAMFHVERSVTNARAGIVVGIGKPELLH
jgi:16S rRNA (guanine527-N7)-methyltransferase